MASKGWFRVGDGTRCDPLTIHDVHSRASLFCKAMVQPKSNDGRLRLEGAFGLPKYMRSDGAPPFGSDGPARLSRLGVWLVRLGVTPVLIEPGRPDQNGRHERFHETLEAETATLLRPTIRAQQQAFDRFQEACNHERPHEALGMKLPVEVYKLSPRPLPATCRAACRSIRTPTVSSSAACAPTAATSGAAGSCRSARRSLARRRAVGMRR